MKIHNDIEQASLEWMMLRAGKVTASGFDSIMTPQFKARDGEMVKTYLATLVAEKWIGPLPTFSSFATDQGTILESADVVPWFEMEYNCDIQRVGFISDDTEKFGCSPDGLIDGKVGVEIKAPQAVAHFKTLLSGKIPDQYLPQVHFSLYVSGFEQWKFISYKRHAPAFVVTVDRDPEIMEKIHDALMPFLDKLDAAMTRLTEINGGPPPRLTAIPRAMPEIKPITTRLAQVNIDEVIP